MKKIKNYCLICFTLTTLGVKSQIVLENTYTKSIWLDKFHLSGYKYVEFNNASSAIINIYNTNHTVYKSITIPTPGFTYSTRKIGYVSEQLFDLDTLIEYVVSYLVTIPNYSKLFIYNELGATVFYRDSASAYQDNPPNSSSFYNGEVIHFNGTWTKMTVVQGVSALTKYEVYSLPGTIPCVECSSGIITGLTPTDEELKKIEPIIYPNPTSGELKLNYKLPLGCTKAKILIFDLNGKQVKEYTITDTFTNILLPEAFNDGMYLYSIKVNNEIIKTEKIILVK